MGENGVFQRDPNDQNIGWNENPLQLGVAQFKTHPELVRWLGHAFGQMAGDVWDRNCSNRAGSFNQTRGMAWNMLNKSWDDWLLLVVDVSLPFYMFLHVTVFHDWLLLVVDLLMFLHRLDPWEVSTPPMAATNPRPLGPAPQVLWGPRQPLHRQGGTLVRRFSLNRW